jgi:hypothetical protein
MSRFVWMGVVLQLVVVVCGHFSEAVLNVSAVLGAGVPFVLGLWYGSVATRRLARSALGGFVIGIASALVAAAAAVLMKDQTWMVLTFAPFTSGATGLLGALIGTAAGGGGAART